MAAVSPDVGGGGLAFSRYRVVVKALRLQELNEMPDLHRLHTEGIFREEALWAISEREGQTKGWWLGHLGIGHNQMHRGEALTVRGWQGVRNR